MKIFFLLCFTFINLNLVAEEWEQFWISAVESYEKKDFSLAEKHFNASLGSLENEGNAIQHAYIYVDRARVHLILKNYEKALHDVNKAISSENLHKQDFLRAIAIRITSRINLGHINEYEEDIEYLCKNSDIVINETETTLIMRNIPKSKEFNEAIAYFLIQNGVCNSQKDIKILTSGVCIVNKVDISKRATQIEERTIEGCKNWCDLHTAGGTTWCAARFRDPRCLAACNVAVFGLQKGCHWCCSEGAFYEKCIQPFADILGAMSKYIKSPCDPEWD